MGYSWSRSVYAEPYTLHPAPAPYALHPTPLSPPPCTLHPPPSTPLPRTHTQVGYGWLVVGGGENFVALTLNPTPCTPRWGWGTDGPRVQGV